MRARVLGLGAGALALAAAGAWTGVVARGQATTFDADARVLARTLAGAELWRERYEPPTPAESLAWVRAERSVREFAVRAADQVALAEAVARSAESLGIADVSIGFMSTDTLTPPPALEVTGQRFAMGPAAVTVELSAEYADIIRLVGLLPAQVTTRGLRIERNGESFRAVLLLLMYESNDDPTSGTS